MRQRRPTGWGVVIAYAALVGATQMLWLTFAPIDTDVARDFHTSQSAIGWPDWPWTAGSVRP
jgi:hypothetical protein